MPAHCTVLARGIAALNGTDALLEYLRDEFQLIVDPLDMYETTFDFEMDCGCDVWLKFHPKRLGRLTARKRSERAVAAAYIERTQCEDHGGTKNFWNGEMSAWVHDPTRPNAFNVAV